MKLLAQTFCIPLNAIGTVPRLPITAVPFNVNPFSPQDIAQLQNRFSHPICTGLKFFNLVKVQFVLKPEFELKPVGVIPTQRTATRDDWVRLILVWLEIAPRFWIQSRAVLVRRGCDASRGLLDDYMLRAIAGNDKKRAPEHHLQDHEFWVVHMFPFWIFARPGDCPAGRIIADHFFMIFKKAESASGP